MADGHRGSGILAISLGFLAYGPPISGELIFRSWADLESGKIRYNALVAGDKLVLIFTAPLMNIGAGVPVAYFVSSAEERLSGATGSGGEYCDFELWHFEDNEREVAFSVFSGEVLEPGTAIRVYPKTAVKHDRDSFHIVCDGKRFPTKVTFLHDSKSVAVSTDDLPHGRYNLVVGELRKEGKKEHANQFYYVVEFVIGKPNKTLVEFGDLQVVHSAQMQLGPGDAGESSESLIHRTKAIDRSTGEPATFATYQSGEVVKDVEQLLAQEGQARLNKFGFMHEDLHRHIQGLQDHEMADVVVWAHVGGRPSPILDYAGGGDASQPVDLPQEVISARHEIIQFITDSGWQVNAVPEDEPYLYASVPKRELVRLAEHRHVGGLFHDDRTYELDLGNSIMIAKSDSVTTAGYSGNNIRVAVHENGPETLKNLVLAEQYDENLMTSQKSDNHARLTHAIVKNVEPNHPNGHAPSCQLYSANSHSNLALDWALDRTRGCTVLSKSFHRGREATSTSLSFDDILYDWKATRWPCPVFSLASGNFGPDDDDKLYVNHKGYNSLKVGSHHDDGLAMAATSEYRMPPSAGDRVLPEIAANGTVVGANDQLSSGTSFAAPAVAGIAALVQQVNPRLQGSPEACRAILLASANRVVVGSSWWGDVAAKNKGSAGAGAVNAQPAITTAQEPRFPYAPPSTYGWDTGVLLPPTDPSYSPYIDSKGVAYARYYVSVPRAAVTKAASTSYAVKAALTWNSEVSSSDQDGEVRPIDSRLKVDLDLYVKDAAGRLVSLSASFDNNYEIVEFYVRPGDTYELSLVKASGVPNTRYGIAWAVHEVPWAVKRP